MAYTKTNWQALPNTTTPINPTNLNKIENGIKTNDDKLLGTVPAGDMIVDSIRSKNMLDQSTICQGDISSTYQTLRLNSRQILWLEAGTYTFSCSNLSTTYDWGIQIQNIGEPPLSSWPSSFIYETSWVAGTTTSRTFTISTAGYFTLMLRKHNESSITPSDVASFNFQLEIGSTATTFVPYQNLDSGTKLQGTFIPTILGLTTAGTATYTTQEGRYLLDGNLLHIEIKLVCTLQNAVGYIGIRGFPIHFGTLHDSSVCNVITDLTTANSPLFAKVYYTQNLLLQYATGGAFSSQNWSSNKTIYLSGTFILN